MKFNCFSFPSNLQILEIDILKLHGFGSISCLFSIWMSLNIIMKTSLRGFKAKKTQKDTFLLYRKTLYIKSR